MAISSALIVLNQQLMNEDGFRYPMALSGLGMGFSAIASYIACKVSVTLSATLEGEGERNRVNEGGRRMGSAY